MVAVELRKRLRVNNERYVAGPDSHPPLAPSHVWPRSDNLTPDSPFPPTGPGFFFGSELWPDWRLMHA